MFKVLSSFGFGLFLGLSIGEKENSEKIKENLEELIKKIKISGESGMEVLVNILKNVEGIDTDELKINIEKIIELIKNKINEIINIEEVSTKLKEKRINSESNDNYKNVKTEIIEIE